MRRLLFSGLYWLACMGVSTSLHGQVDSVRLTKPKMPDSLSMKWENGKLIMPQTGINAGQLKGLPTIKGKTDGIFNDQAGQMPNVAPQEFIKGQIYSSTQVKAIFDSLGLGRMDTLLALASLKDEVGPDELMKRINHSFDPNAPQELEKLSRSKLSGDVLSSLPPVDGMRIPALPLSDPGWMKHLILKKLDSLKSSSALQDKDQWTQRLNSKRDSLLNYRSKTDSLIDNANKQTWPKPKLDSLQALREQAVHRLDSLNKLRGRIDSLTVQYAKAESEIQARLQQGTEQADALQTDWKKTNKLFKVKQSSSVADLKNIELTQRPRFWSPFYFEGLASGFKSVNGRQEFQLAPSVGYEIKSGFSLGGSPNFHVSLDESKVNLTTGYRAFAKYRVLKSRAYLQTEDMYNPLVVPDNKTRHNVLMGGGGLLPISKKLAINAAIFYRVSGSSNPSDWVFRVGISSIAKQKL